MASENTISNTNISRGIEGRDRMSLIQSWGMKLIYKTLIDGGVVLKLFLIASVNFSNLYSLHSLLLIPIFFKKGDIVDR